MLEKMQCSYGRRFALGVGLLLMPLLSGCSAAFIPAGPNLIGAGNFHDESLDEGDALFQKKKLGQRENLPAPDVTGALGCTVASQTRLVSGYRVRIHQSMDCLLKK